MNRPPVAAELEAADHMGERNGKAASARRKAAREGPAQLLPLFYRWAADFTGWVAAIAGAQAVERICTTPLPPPEATAIKWLNCGVVWEGEFVSVAGPEGPGRPLDSTMLDLLEVGTVRPEYFLSPNAATGMLRRADRMQRKFLPALRRALERLAVRDEKTGLARRPAEGKQ